MQSEYTPRRLQVYDTPTVFNKEMAIGALIGFGPIGMIVGGLVGKARMNSEKNNGKMVGEPSAWNKDTILGGLLGGLAGAAVLALVAGTGFGLAAGMAAYLGGMAAGGFIGGQHGKGVQQAEYYKAIDQEQYFARQSGQGLAQAPAQDMQQPGHEQTTYRDMVRNAPPCEHQR